MFPDYLLRFTFISDSMKSTGIFVNSTCVEDSSGGQLTDLSTCCVTLKSLM